MKIMYIDASTDGHHLIYLNSLLRAASQESLAVLPENPGQVEGRVKTIAVASIRSFREYGAWMRALQKIAAEEKPDIVHFLDGDTMMRHFGRGLGGFGTSRVYITFHHLFPGKAREISMRRMLRHAEAGIFHTEEICKKVREAGCRNVICIPYPCFLDCPQQKGAGYRHRTPRILALGGTRYDKGLDILLEALQKVQEPFELVIAGKQEDFDEAFIRRQAENYQDSVRLFLHFLTEGEVGKQLQAADIIVLPYRKVFDGASGPMCEGIYLGKTIIGPEHGSLGTLIKKNHVGYTFESENTDSLAKCLETALRSPCIYDETADRAQRELRPELFVERYRRLYIQE